MVYLTHKTRPSTRPPRKSSPADGSTTKQPSPTTVGEDRRDDGSGSGSRPDATSSRSPSRTSPNKMESKFQRKSSRISRPITKQEAKKTAVNKAPMDSSASAKTARTEKTRKASNQRNKISSTKNPVSSDKKQALGHVNEKQAVENDKKLLSQAGEIDYNKLNREWKKQLTCEDEDEDDTSSDESSDDSSCSSSDDDTYSHDESGTYFETDYEQDSASMYTDDASTLISITDDEDTVEVSKADTVPKSTNSTTASSSADKAPKPVARSASLLRWKINKDRNAVESARKENNGMSASAATGNAIAVTDNASITIAEESAVSGTGGSGNEQCTEDEYTLFSNGSVGTAPTVMTDFMRMEALTSENREHQLTAQVVEHGTVDKLLMQATYIPKPKKSSDVVIKIDCSSITLQDCMIRRGEWYDMQPLPFVPGSDFVGIIHDMGDEATKNSIFKRGDKVAAVVPSGANAKYITLSYKKIIKVPTEVDSVVALCLTTVYVPAREALDLARKLNMPLTGANVLIIGGDDPIGLATIELALLEGANVFTASDERHHGFLGRLGARSYPIDANKWLPALEGKMDVVLDAVCLDEYESSHLALTSSGTLVCMGMSAVYTQGPVMAYGMWDMRDYKAVQCKMRAKFMMNKTVYYDRMERYNLDLNEYAQHFRYLCHLEAKDAIMPLVSTRAPLSLIASTQESIENDDASYGICVCTPWITSADLNAGK